MRLNIKKKIMKKIIPLALLVGAAVVTSACNSNTIEQKQVVKDITYLASDELKGRANFSPEITKAAAYIGQRFKAAGLVPLAGEASFEQAFTLYNISVSDAKLRINGELVERANIAVATSHETLTWNDVSAVNVVTISKNQDVRQALARVNQQGGDTLVLVDPRHQGIFGRYKQYFSGGLNKFASNEGASLVMVLMPSATVDTLSLSASAKVKEQQLANVVGVLPGKRKEVVLFSAHYDHLGMDEKGEGDRIYNGADDDASGTTAVMNLAQYYAAQGKPERTLMFSAFTAEEIGGYGSKYFSGRVDADSMTAMVNIEMIGKPSKFGAGTFWMTGFERSDLGALMNQSLKAIEQEVYPDPYPKQRLFYRSDNATLARLGVPAHSFSSTQLDKDKHYHQHSDDVASLDLDSMTQVIKAIAIGSQGLVDGRVAPTRVDTSKVKASGKIF